MNWQQANQRHLTASLARVRESLRRACGKAAADAEEIEEAIAVAEAELPSPSALQRLCSLFQLSPFERDLLLLCAGVELDSELAGLCADALGTRPRAADAFSPTFGLALSCLADSHWSALLPAAPLRYWRMIEVGTGAPLTASPLKIDERALHFLMGAHYTDERLESLLERVQVGQGLPPSQFHLAEQTAAMLANGEGTLPVVALHGQDFNILRNVAAETGARLGLQIQSLRAAEIPPQPVERAALARLWERESLLTGSAMLIEIDESDHHLPVCAFAEKLISPLFVASRWPLGLNLPRPVVRVAVGKPQTGEQRDFWRQTFGDRSESLNGFIPALTTQFNLTVPMIQAVCAETLPRLAEETSLDRMKSSLWDACREQSRPRLEELAQRMENRAEWDDLVLPAMQKEILREIVAHVRHRHTVYESWGFAARSSRGLGTSAVFAGASGTGKTLAAEVLANLLRLDLYRIDLSAVVSKYIGETEKNLRRIFDAAETGGAILLFDEADALFGKRSEVKDSHDRYANIEVSFLLQQMEAYRGLAILTTNQLSAFDSAFLRRVRFIAQFPFPAPAERAAIWARAFPADTPLAALDFAKLARLEIAGGDIRNIALNAAFLAADQTEPVRMTHLLRAAIGEYSKLEKPLLEAEVKDWLEDYAN